MSRGESYNYFNQTFRMSVGEDKNKVQNLVKPLVTQFSSLYMAEIENMSEFVVFNRLDKTFTQDISPNVRHFHLALLPKNLQTFLLRVKLINTSF